jgi:hypothetical protein
VGAIFLATGLYLGFNSWTALSSYIWLVIMVAGYTLMVYSLINLINPSGRGGVGLISYMAAISMPLIAMIAYDHGPALRVKDFVRQNVGSISTLMKVTNNATTSSLIKSNYVIWYQNTLSIRERLASASMEFYGINRLSGIPEDESHADSDLAHIKEAGLILRNLFDAHQKNRSLTLVKTIVIATPVFSREKSFQSTDVYITKDPLGGTLQGPHTETHTYGHCEYGIRIWIWDVGSKRPLGTVTFDAEHDPVLAMYGWLEERSHD